LNRASGAGIVGILKLIYQYRNKVGYRSTAIDYLGIEEVFSSSSFLTGRTFSIILSLRDQVVEIKLDKCESVIQNTKHQGVCVHTK
jgi:hypothetical protein